MKKLFSILSLLTLAVSNILPAYTYANVGDNTEVEIVNTQIINENVEDGTTTGVNQELEDTDSDSNQNQQDADDNEYNDVLSGEIENEESVESADNQEGTIIENISESLISLFGDKGEEQQNEGINTNTIRETTLITGSDFAYEIKKLSNPNFNKDDYYDDIIKHIKRAEEDNSNGKTTAILSIEGSEYPVKAWFENENGEGEIYYYTEADKIYLNPNSSFMFAFFRELISVDLTQFDSTNVENLSYMFYYDASIQSLDFSKFKTPNLTNFGSIIRYSTSIREIDLSNFDTSHVTSMADLFEGCTALETVIMDNWDFGATSSMSSIGWGIFENNTNLKRISARGWKNLPNDMHRAGYDFFTDAISGSLDVTDWDTSNVTDMRSLFYGLKKLTEITGVETWNTTNVIDMDHMFQNVEKVKYLNLSGLVSESVTDLHELFENCYELEKVDGLNTWDTKNVTSIGGMFRYTNIKTVNLDNWDLRNLRSYSNEINFADGGSSMFYNANSLTGISARNWKVPGDLYNWTYYWGIYDSPIKVIDVSNWETTNVTKMNFMFTDLSSQINIIGLDTRDTKNVTNMAGMFARSTGIEILDLNNFDTSKVTNMNSMFQGASNLRTIYAGDKFIVNDGVSDNNMFSGAISLVGGNGTQFDENYITSEFARWDIVGTPGYFSAKTYSITYDLDGGTMNGEKSSYAQTGLYLLPIPAKSGNEFIGRYESGTDMLYTYVGNDIKGDKVFYAKWKTIEEKAQESTAVVVYTDDTTVEIDDEGEHPLTGSTTAIELKTKEVESEEVMTVEDKTKVQEAEIKVSSDKTVEYEGGIEVYLEKKESEETKIITGTAKFSAPIAVKIPVSSNSEYVKVQVKHYGEEFGYKGLTLNPVNECEDGIAKNERYNGEDIEVKGSDGEKYALVYTCSASTFVAYTESAKSIISQPAAGGGRVIKQETKATEQEHNSADLEKESENTKSSDVNKSSTTRTNETVEQKIKKVEGKALTRGEVAVMTNILLEVFPQLIEGNKGLDDVTKACSSYTDEKDFTKDEKKAITRLCKLSIMGIHVEDKTALEEFMVSKDATNNEFNVVVNRAIENYNEKDFEAVKEALKKLENDEESVVFGTVYDVFMSIKNIFN